MATLQERLKTLRKKLDFTQDEMGNVFGIKKSAYSMIENGRAQLTVRNRETLIEKLFVNKNWLLNGEGEMFDQERKILAENYANQNSNSNFQLVPVYNMDVVGGFSPNSEEDCKSYISTYVPFVNARKMDIAMPISGNSMYPTYPAGAVVLLREVESWREYIEFGQVYVLVLNDGRRILKEVRRSDDKEHKSSHFLCVSHNPQYDPAELPINMVHSMYIVKAVYYETTI